MEGEKFSRGALPPCDPGYGLALIVCFRSVIFVWLYKIIFSEKQSQVIKNGPSYYLNNSNRNSDTGRSRRCTLGFCFASCVFQKTKIASF